MSISNLRVLGLSALLTVLAGCGSSSGGSAISAPPIAGCSIAEQNTFVFDLMNDIYFWIDDVPAVTNVGFSSPEEVLQAFLFEPLDRFSGLRDLEENTAFFSNSQFIGLGLSFKVVDENRLRLAQVFGDGAAAAAGLARGDELIRIDGRDVSDIIAANELGTAFGASEEGVTVTLDYIDAMGSTLQAQLTKGLVTIETVTLTTEFDVAGRTVGYLAFRNFVEPSFDALADAFAQLNAAGVESLILDLRYNGGGLVDVAEQLGSLIGGAQVVGETFARRVHNANNASRDFDALFSTEPNALSITDLVVITTGSTASASELVINSLIPFIPVTVVGEASFGKPVGAYQFEFCDKVAVPTAFASVNALGDGDFFDGFVPDCPAADDLDRALGDPMEASLAEALFVVQNGSCSPVSGLRATSTKRSRDRDVARKVGQSLNEFDLERNAF
ncbi:MAG: S41 family peptidase [Gammaproteobacteria bacterium]